MLGLALAVFGRAGRPETKRKRKTREAKTKAEADADNPKLIHFFISLSRTMVWPTRLSLAFLGRRFHACAGFSYKTNEFAMIVGNQGVTLQTLVLSFRCCRVKLVAGGTHQCATESRMTLWRSANPVRAVGASPVILSRLANVFVSLSSVMVFRMVKLYFSKPIVAIVFCGMLEYLQ